MKIDHLQNGFEDDMDYRMGGLDRSVLLEKEAKSSTASGGHHSQTKTN